MNFISPLARLRLAIALLAVLAAPALARTLEEKLPNGLRIIVREDARAPTVVHQVWYRVGSMDEQVGKTGISHVLEHMMFKGTPKFGPGEFSRRITEIGGRENAFTDRDSTVYFQQVPRSGLALCMQLEADRMQNLLLPPKEYAKEIRVVMEERRLRTEDSPRSLVEEDMMAGAFFAHSYGWPVVGWMSDLENLSVRDLRDWYRRWYAPGNAVVIIVGDVDAARTLEEARRIYGRVPARTLAPRQRLAEPPQRGLRRLEVKAPADQSYILMGYKAPTVLTAAQDWEPYALEVLATVLAGYDAARLNQALVRERRLAHEISASYHGITRGPGMLYIDGVPAGEAAQLEAALREQLAALGRSPISAEELERAKAQVIAREVYARDSLFRQAMEMGQFETTGRSWREVEQLPERLRAVSAGQVQQVAARYLNEDRLTLGVLLPQPIGERKPSPGVSVREVPREGGVR